MLLNISSEIFANFEAGLPSGWLPHRRLDGGAAVNATYHSGETPLYFAARAGQLRVAKTLLERGAAVHKSSINGRTPLWIAVDHRHVKVAALLVSKGAEVDQASKSGWTPLVRGPARD